MGLTGYTLQSMMYQLGADIIACSVIIAVTIVFSDWVSSAAMGKQLRRIADALEKEQKP